MSFLATHLAEDAGLKVAVAPTATATLVETTSRSAAATSTAATAAVVLEVTSPAFGGDVDGRVRSPITDLTPLLIAYELGLEFLKRDGVRTA